ncbi:hypothetical protein CR513_09566, partial [Mucuna pruriens]
MHRYINLLTTFRDPCTVPTILVCYLIVEVDTSYNVLIDWPVLNTLGAIVSIQHLVIEFPSSYGQVVIVKADQKMARQCYVDNLRVVSKLQREDNVLIHVEISTDVELDPRPPIDQGVEPIEKLEKIPLTDDEHCTQIGETMQGPHREQLISTLRGHANLFACQSSDMPGINPKVIYHHLEEGKYKTRYTALAGHFKIIEKLILTLVTSARWLRPYFQAYTLVIRIDHPIWQVL